MKALGSIYATDGVSFKISRVFGSRPKKKWGIFENDKLIDKAADWEKPWTKKRARTNLEFWKAGSKHPAQYKMREI